MSIKQQIEMGQLVCPKTKQKLSIVDDSRWLENIDKTERYRLLDGRVPVLLNSRSAKEYVNEQEIMNEFYGHITKRNNTFLSKVKSELKKYSLPNRIKSILTEAYRTESSEKAFFSLFLGLPSHALCISIGGGPSRDHPMLFNLNIGPFVNVDVVGDAYSLPYADECVDVILSSAVFEHLKDPVQAAKEMYRVLKPGRKACIRTPFLQAYHGAPHHYQNYTITGHAYLFESVGFQIVEAGVDVGPVYTIVNLVTVFIDEYFPYLLKKPIRYLWATVGLFIRPLDKYLGRKKNAYILASTTYVIVEKGID